MNKYKHYLSATCIIKNEAEYMPEWLEYHILQGIEKFYIYDNDSTDNIKEILQPYIADGIVEYIYWPGIAMQMPAYKDCVSKYKNDTFWLAVIDIDEFIVPDTGVVANILKGFEEFAAVVLQWLVYGDNEQQTKQPGLVIERFKSHGYKTKTGMCKAIINPRRTLVKYVHLPEALPGYISVNSCGEKALPLSNCILSNGTWKNLHINHYIFKSYEEFLIKKQKGDVLSTKTPRFHKDEKVWAQAYFEFNRNEIKNDEMMDKYVSLVQKAIYNRYKK